VLKNLFAAAALGAAALALCPTPAHANGVFVTGHDPDYHCWSIRNQIVNPGSVNIMRRAMTYVTGSDSNPAGIANPRILLITDLRNPGGDSRDPRLCLTQAGFIFDTADYGSGTPGVVNLKTVPFTNYDVLLVASDYGGWLHQEEVDVLVSRKTELISYINHGGGMVVLNEGGNRPLTSPDAYPGVTTNRFAFLPSLVSETPLTQHEVGFTVTALGQRMGLVDSDVNDAVCHSFFSQYAGYNPVDVDNLGRVVSVATRSQLTPEGIPDNTPPTLTVDSPVDLLWPPNHDLIDVKLRVTATDDHDLSPKLKISVYSDLGDAEGTDDGKNGSPANFSPDVRLTSTSLRLRSERAGGDNGRIYLIVVTATDSAGNVSTHTCTIVVPHDQSPQSIRDVKARAAAIEAAYALSHQIPAGFVPVGDGPVRGPKQ
jgi:hypothetical protein